MLSCQAVVAIFTLGNHLHQPPRLEYFQMNTGRRRHYSRNDGELRTGPCTSVSKTIENPRARWLADGSCDFRGGATFVMFQFHTLTIIKVFQKRKPHCLRMKRKPGTEVETARRENYNRVDSFPPLPDNKSNSRAQYSAPMPSATVKENSMWTPDRTPESWGFSRHHEPACGEAVRIAIKDKARICFIDARCVLAVVAQGDFVILQREFGSYLLRMSISAMAEKLEPLGFVRIHRSALVNSAWVEEIRSQATGEYRLRLRGGREFAVTRTYKKNLRLLAKVWLANGAFLDS